MKRQYVDILLHGSNSSIYLDSEILAKPMIYAYPVYDHSNMAPRTKVGIPRNLRSSLRLVALQEVLLL